jgi:hypothetical protein
MRFAGNCGVKWVFDRKLIEILKFRDRIDRRKSPIGKIQIPIQPKWTKMLISQLKVDVCLFQIPLNPPLAKGEFFCSPLWKRGVRGDLLL